MTVDAPNKTLVPDLVTGAPFLFPVLDWDGARLLLVVGQNTVVSHGHAVARPNAVVALRRLQGPGGAIVVADPRTTETARLADLHLPLRPGSDPALLALLVRRCSRRGGGLRFPGRVCRAGLGGAGCAGSVEPFNLEVVAGRCGIEPARRDEVIRLVLAAGRVVGADGHRHLDGSRPQRRRVARLGARPR